MIFRQLFHYDTYTYTYLLACSKTREAIIIDPVDDMIERDLNYVKELGLDLIYGINTHVHADHVTGTGKLKSALPNLKSVISAKSGATADKYVENGNIIRFGTEYLECRETPGHTGGCTSFVSHDHKMVFTGDAILIRACGRTDFQQGNPSQLYDSIHKQIFTLPDLYQLFPGHDYKGFTSSTILEEKTLNPRLTLSKDKFIEFMRELNLAYPKLIDISVPANLKCGSISKEAVDGSQQILDKIQ
nr:persulfide dioxygenase ETHE1, mitochondrial-like isoform X2 [Styela clava]